MGSVFTSRKEEAVKRVVVVAMHAVLMVLVVACSGSDASDVRIEVSNHVPGFDSMGPFAATGGAVDDGVMCASGEGSLMAAEETADGGILSEFELRCTDGDDFRLQLQVPPELVTDQAAWDRAVDGTLEVNTPWIVLTGQGRFAGLEGDGMSGWRALEPGKGPGDGGGVLTVFEGDLTVSG